MARGWALARQASALQGRLLLLLLPQLLWGGQGLLPQASASRELLLLLLPLPLPLLLVWRVPAWKLVLGGVPAGGLCVQGQKMAQAPPLLQEVLLLLLPLRAS